MCILNCVMSVFGGGDPGSPPPNTDMTQFKMHIPIRPDERQGGSDAGQGKVKVRKG